MAFGDVLAYTDGAEASPGLDLTCTSGMAVSAGDMLVCAFSVIADKTADNLRISDNLGNTWNLVGSASYSTVTVAKWWCRVTNGGTLTPTVAWNTSTTGDGAIVLVKYEGPFASGNPVDVTPANTADATSPYATSATGVLAQANELVVVAAGHSRGIVITATSPMTKSREQMTGTGSNTASCALLAKVVSSTASTTPGYTGSSYAGVQQIFSMKQQVVPQTVNLDPGIACTGSVGSVSVSIHSIVAATPISAAQPYQESWATLAMSGTLVTLAANEGMTAATHDLASVTGKANVTPDTQLGTASSNEVSTKVVNHADLTMDGMTAAAGDVSVQAKGTAQITGAIGGTASTNEVASVTGKGSVTLEGVQAAASCGDVSVQAKATVTLDTQLGTAAPGDESVEAEGRVTLASFEATSAVGDATATAAEAVSFELVGVAGTADAGSVTVAVTATAALESFEATAALGEPSETGKATVQVADSFEASAAVGDVVAAAITQAEVDGVEATASSGAVTTLVAMLVQLGTPDAATGFVGTTSFSEVRAFELGGHEATGAAGDIAPTTEQTIALESFQATGSIGQVSVTAAGITSVDLTGFEASAQLGELAFQTEQTLALDGLQAAGELGAPSISLPRSIAVGGFQAGSGVGALGWLQANQAALAGHEAGSSPGSLSIALPRSVALEGHPAAAAAGELGLSITAQVELAGHSASGLAGAAQAEIRTGATLAGFEAQAGQGSVAILAHSSLAASPLAAASPALEQPALGQHHFLVSADLTVGSPELPLLMPGGFTVEALPLTIGSPALGTPRVTHLHSYFQALPLTVGSPQFIHPGAAVELVALTLKIERGEAQLLIDVTDAELDVQCGRVMLEVDYDWVQWWESAA